MKQLPEIQLSLLLIVNLSAQSFLTLYTYMFVYSHDFSSNHPIIHFLQLSFFTSGKKNTGPDIRNSGLLLSSPGARL